ncbi:MAG: hypothetical protein Q9168_005972 [Polycauliona sp. 1 TL-2023]
MLRVNVLIILTVWATYSQCVHAAADPPALRSPHLFAPNASFSLPSAIRRIDPPSDITLTVKRNGPGVPDDTIVFTFDKIRMATDDVTMAMLAIFKAACERLSSASGQDGEVVKHDFAIRDKWYRFELGWDAYGPRPLLISELLTIVTKLWELSRVYFMRQVTFKYLLAGQFHATGRLRNPAAPAPRRQDALQPRVMNIPHGHIIWADFDRKMEFEVVADTMMSLLGNGWVAMSNYHKASRKLHVPNPFMFNNPQRSVRFTVSAPQKELSLGDVMDVAYYTVMFGRLFNMQEHHCALTSTYYPQPVEILGSIVKGHKILDPLNHIKRPVSLLRREDSKVLRKWLSILNRSGLELFNDGDNSKYILNMMLSETEARARQWMQLLEIYKDRMFSIQSIMDSADNHDAVRDTMLPQIATLGVKVRSTTSNLYKLRKAIHAKELERLQASALGLH